MQKLSSNIVQTQAAVEFKFTFPAIYMTEKTSPNDGRSLYPTGDLTSIAVNRFNNLGNSHSTVKQTVV